LNSAITEHGYRMSAAIIRRANSVLSRPVMMKPKNIYIYIHIKSF